MFGIVHQVQYVPKVGEMFNSCGQEEKIGWENSHHITQIWHHQILLSKSAVILLGMLLVFLIYGI